MLACKAFIVASEDSQKGTSQKGKEFKATMHSAYKLLIKEQLECDHRRGGPMLMLLQGSS